jgi:FtsH-binding integral membrane protein
MATRVELRAPIRRARYFFTSAALACLLTALAGFAPTYYLLSFNDGKPLPLLVQLHGAACTAWLVLLFVQTRLIATGRADVHRKMGMAAALLAVAIVGLGFAVAIVSGRHGRVHAASFSPQTMLLMPLVTASFFGAFVALGIATRRAAATHKRYMYLATLMLIVPALARIARMLQPSLLPSGVVGGLILSNLFLVGLAAYDWRTLQRLHPVTLWAGLVYLLSEPLRVLVGLSVPWQAFAKILIG